MKPFQAKVFISCGQSPTEERAARDVEAWFVTKEFRAYLAIKVNNLPDLNRKIIEELKSSDYFVFINFARYSVYANQELAVAIALGFEDRMILFNQRGAKKKGIFEFMTCNGKFDTFAEIVPIIEESVLSAGWHNSSSRHLSVEKPEITPALYYDEGRHRDGRLLYIAHIDVRNSRPDISADNCAIRLVKIESPSQGERPSPDRSPLKVTGRGRAYKENIWPNSIGTFDLFGIDANSYTYLLSESDVNESDVKRSAIISTREKHILTYEIFAPGFPKATAKIVVDFEERMSPPLPMAGFPGITSSGYRTHASVSAFDPLSASVPSELETPDPIPKISLPKIRIAHPS